MSAFNPDIPQIARPGPAQVLGRFVPTALRRPPSVAKVWTLPKLFVLGTLTAGFWPCRALHVRLRQTLTMHATQCGLASRMLATQLPADDAAIVDEAAKRVDVSHAWIAASMVLAAAALATAVAWLNGHGWAIGAWRQWWLHGPAGGDTPALVSVGLLAAAFVVLIAPMNRQLLAMQQYALAFNAACGERVPPIDPPPLVWGMRPGHLLVGAMMAYVGLLWALPMTLTWAAFDSFANTAAQGFRVQLAERLATLGGVEPVIAVIDLCANPDCRQVLSGDAQFCPRCGRATAPV